MNMDTTGHGGAISEQMLSDAMRGLPTMGVPRAAPDSLNGECT